MTTMLKTFQEGLAKNAAPIGRAIMPALFRDVEREEPGMIKFIKQRKGHLEKHLGPEITHRGFEAARSNIEKEDNSPTGKMLKNQHLQRLYGPTSGMGKFYRSTDGAR